MKHALIYGESATGKTLEARTLINKYLKDSQTGSLLIYDYKAVDYLDYENNPRLFRPICSEPQTNWFIHFLEDAYQEEKNILIVMDVMSPHLINQEKELISKLMFKDNITLLLVIYDYTKLDNQILKQFENIIHKDRINRRK